MKFSNIFRFIYLTCIISFVAWFIFKNIDAIKESFLSIGLFGFTLAFTLSVLSYFMLAKLFVIIQTYSEKPAKRISLSNWFCGFMFSFMGRYIPGKVSIILGRIHYFSKFGISKKSLVITALYENFLIIVAASLLSIPALLVAFVTPSDIDHYILLICAAILIIYIFIFSSLFERIFIIFLTFFKLPHPDKSIFLSKIEIVHSLFYAFLAMFFMGSSFFVLLVNTTSIEVNFCNLILIAGAYMLSGAIGIIALFAPSGLGVREGVAVYLIYSVLHMASVTELIAVLIFIRAVCILVEFFLCCISCGLHYRNIFFKPCKINLASNRNSD